MKLIVGLGNPGLQYAGTRHNVGFMAVDLFAGERRVKIDQWKYEALTGRARVAGENVMLMKPQTYMNLSGRAVIRAVRDLDLTPQQVFVIHDDMDLPLGQIRIRQQGNAAGHNGMKSITAVLGTEAFPRIRIGIGRPLQNMDPAGYVLEPFDQSEMAILNRVIAETAEALYSLLYTGIERTMGRYNRRDLTTDIDNKESE